VSRAETLLERSYSKYLTQNAGREAGIGWTVSCFVTPARMRRPFLGFLDNDAFKVR
jgi:hypothetical protein